MLKQFYKKMTDPYHKGETQGKQIGTMGVSKELYFYLEQHIGRPAEPVVKEGDLVKKGQMIANSPSLISAPVHASTSGKIKAIKDVLHPSLGLRKAIILESDGLDQWEEGIPFSQNRDYEKLSPTELVEIVKNAGIVGLGGAGFPTHVKLSSAFEPGNPIHTVCLNGAECEPYLTSDDIIMRTKFEEIVLGIKIILKITKAKKLLIGIESNKPYAIKAMKKAVTGIEGCKVVSLPTKYPQGAEKNLIKSLTGIKIKPGKLPMSAGLLVINVTTTYAIARAVEKGIPLIEKVVTVAGSAINNPQNILVPIGTKWSDILNHCGVQQNLFRLIMGGPMMGIAQSSLDAAVIKGTNGLLGFTEEEVKQLYSNQGPCIRCGKCVTVCSADLRPYEFHYYVRDRKWSELDMESVQPLRCIECGACSFNCPAQRSCLHDVKLLKSKLRKK